MSDDYIYIYIKKKRLTFDFLRSVTFAGDTMTDGARKWLMFCFVSSVKMTDVGKSFSETL